jgi:acylphosphatase
VWFRDECQRRARAEGIGGWVRNLADGRVEAVFEGPAEAVDRMVEWCRHGPPRAQVADVEVRREQPVGEIGFSVR